MMARGFRPVGWVAALGAAALGCYMLSLRVASERHDLARLDAKIVAAQQNIRTLRTEVGTRSRIPQLEDWNEEVLALAAPAAGQFVSANVSLARFDMRAPPQAAEPAEIRLASAETAAPTPHQATPAPAPVQRAVAAPAPVAAPQAQVRRASLDVGAPAPIKARADAPRERARPAPAPVRVAAAPERRREPAPIRTASRDERRQAAAPAPTRLASAQPPRARPASAPTRAAAGTVRPARALLDGRTMRELGDRARGERQRGTRD
ncbi:MAG TPA: hypothetical protein VGO55_15680 [Allosphingosinicella sp.]|jgi:hypothetical protein|nr:hypothetical protein [Allosphingosinicella sp.]